MNTPSFRGLVNREVIGGPGKVGEPGKIRSLSSEGSGNLAVD